MKLEIGASRITLHAQTAGERERSESLASSVGNLFVVHQAGGRGLVFDALPDQDARAAVPLNIAQGGECAVPSDLQSGGHAVHPR